MWPWQPWRQPAWQWLLAACGGDGGGTTQNADGNDEVAVGVIPIVDVAPIYLGQQEGFFEDGGIELTLESGQGGAAIVPGVECGQFQFGFSNNTSLLVAQQQGLADQGRGRRQQHHGRGGQGLRRRRRARGQRHRERRRPRGRPVAVNTLNNIGSTTINNVVREDGGDPTSIEYVELAFPDMPAARRPGPGGRRLGRGAVPDDHHRPGRDAGRLELRRHRPRADDRVVLHLAPSWPRRTPTWWSGSRRR